MDKKWLGKKGQNDNVVGSSEFGGANFGPKLKESDAKSAGEDGVRRSAESWRHNNGVSNVPSDSAARMTRYSRDGKKMQTVKTSGLDPDSDPDLDLTAEEKKRMGY